MNAINIKIFNNKIFMDNFMFILLVMNILSEKYQISKYRKVIVNVLFLQFR
jgi:hypothetical protein